MGFLAGAYTGKGRGEWKSHGCIGVDTGLHIFADNSLAEGMGDGSALGYIFFRLINITSVELAT